MFLQQPHYLRRALVQLRHHLADRLQRRLPCLRFRDVLQQPHHQRLVPRGAQAERVAQKMHLAALPHRALKMPLHRAHQTLVIVRNHVAHAAQSALLQLCECLKETNPVFQRQPGAFPRNRALLSNGDKPSSWICKRCAVRQDVPNHAP